MNEYLGTEARTQRPPGQSDGTGSLKSSLVVLVANAKTTSGPDRATLEFPRYNASVHFLKSIPKAGEEDRWTRTETCSGDSAFAPRTAFILLFARTFIRLQHIFQSQGNVKWRLWKVTVGRTPLCGMKSARSLRIASTATRVHRHLLAGPRSHVADESTCPTQRQRCHRRVPPTHCPSPCIRRSPSRQRALGWRRGASGSGNRLNPVLEERQSDNDRRSLCGNQGTNRWHSCP